jgi:dTDP-4-amino-4,6-dideoxygalactose transaminase
MAAVPPVRSRVSLRRGDPEKGRQSFSRLFPGREVHLYDSGTTALGIALRDARLRHGSVQPEAVLPAYGCPQLVAACQYASVRSRLVDTAAGHWGYDLEQLRAALSPNTVAIVAVNLLGTGDQAAELLRLARANRSFLIQDSAQDLPAPGTASWCADYIVLSFGRGKPLNLLRGGALAVSADCPLQVNVSCKASLFEKLKDAALGSRAAAAAFNGATHSRVYRFTARVPGLGLGETRFRALNNASELSFKVWGQLGLSYENYLREPIQFLWSGVLEEWERLGIRRLTCLTGVPTQPAHCLRLALLVDDRHDRDAIVDILNRRGFGASKMYGATLNQISAIPLDVASQGPFPNALRLSRQLLTLPTHALVTPDIVTRASNCIYVASAAETGRFC